MLSQMVIQFGCWRQAAEVTDQAGQARAGVRHDDRTDIAALQRPRTYPQTQFAIGPAAPVELKQFLVVQPILAQDQQPAWTFRPGTGPLPQTVCQKSLPLDGQRTSPGNVALPGYGINEHPFAVQPIQ